MANSLTNIGPIIGIDAVRIDMPVNTLVIYPITSVMMVMARTSNSSFIIIKINKTINMIVLIVLGCFLIVVKKLLNSI